MPYYAIDERVALLEQQVATLQAAQLTLLGETPSGSINGSNVTFYLSRLPYQGLWLYLNGEQMREGIDYSRSSREVVMSEAPLSGDSLDARYFYLTYGQSAAIGYSCP